MEKTIEKIWNIDEIEAMDEKTAQGMALESLDIKGHTVYLVDFGGYFGYSALVFADGRPIKYANDYALHHGGGTGPEELRELYIDRLNRRLFTEEEITGPVKDYDDYEHKSDYLRNLYGLRRPYVSAFGIFRTDADKKRHEKAIKGKVYNPVSFGYYDDRAFVAHHAELFKKLVEENEQNKNSFDYWKSAFLKEMFNHEYGINWQADYDVVSVFANVDGVRDYANRENLWDAAGFSEVQRQAYVAARKEYARQSADMY